MAVITLYFCTITEEGVINKNLQVWGIPNLYVCSQAVFPTSSHSNPALTLMALGMKLCNHLNEKNKLITDKC